MRRGRRLSLLSVLIAAMLVASPLLGQPAASAGVPRLSPPNPAPIDLLFPNTVSVRRIYHSLADATGLRIVFDPKLRDQQIEIGLHSVEPLRALDLVTRSAGHFYKVLDTKSVLIAADTPQNRRDYETLAIKTFFLDNVRAVAMQTILRSIIEAKKLAVHEELNTLTMRDTVERVEVAARIVDLHDRPRPEMALAVELLRVERKALLAATRALVEGRRGDSAPTTLPQRLSPAEHARLRQITSPQTLAAPRLSLIDGDSASFRLGTQLALLDRRERPGDDEMEATYAHQKVGIELKVRGQLHSEDSEVTLDVEVEAICFDAPAAGQGGASVQTAHLTSTIRLADGETLLLSGFLPSGKESAAPPLVCAGELAAPGKQPPSELLLSMTPTITRRTQLTEAERAALLVGTETHIELEQLDP